MTQCLTLAIGGNFSSSSKDLVSFMECNISLALRRLQLSLVAASSLYSTAPQGCPGRQPRYLNAILLCRAKMAPAQLLRGLKQIEREAGRRAKGINAPRPLDFDVIDLGGRVMGWPRRSAPLRHGSRRETKRTGRVHREPRAWLTLPHPELHRRRFVLEPLMEVAPNWQHPVMKVTAKRLLARLPRRPGEIERMLDSRWLSCEDKPNLHGQG